MLTDSPPAGRPADQLMATCWTSAGDAASDRADLRSPLTLRRRIEGAAAAGFTGFGLLSDDLPAAIAEYRLTGIKTLLADNGITHLELEGIPYWWSDGPEQERSDRIRAGLLEAAEVLGARHIEVTPDGDDRPWDRNHWAEKFAELAAQAHDVGARLGLEFFPPVRRHRPPAPVLWRRRLRPGRNDQRLAHRRLGRPVGGRDPLRRPPMPTRGTGAGARR